MGVQRVKQRLQVSGPIDMGSTADVRMVRTAADSWGLGSGDKVDLSTNNNNILLPGGTAACATASFPTASQMRICTNGGTPGFGLNINGTVYFFKNDATVSS